MAKSGANGARYSPAAVQGRMLLLACFLLASAPSLVRCAPSIPPAPAPAVLSLPLLPSLRCGRTLWRHTAGGFTRAHTRAHARTTRARARTHTHTHTHAHTQCVHRADEVQSLFQFAKLAAARADEMHGTPRRTTIDAADAPSFGLSHDAAPVPPGSGVAFHPRLPVPDLARVNPHRPLFVSPPPFPRSWCLLRQAGRNSEHERLLHVGQGWGDEPKCP